MLVTTIEIWPGGAVEYRRTLGVLALANISSLAPVSSYSGVRFDDTGVLSPVAVNDHRRSAGFWPLISTASAAIAPELTLTDLQEDIYRHCQSAGLQIPARPPR